MNGWQLDNVGYEFSGTTGDTPDGRPVRAPEPSNVVEFPAVHGLHHVYLPKAA